jgi:LuxR family maltose regulon positive regulatory protein
VEHCRRPGKAHPGASGLAAARCRTAWVSLDDGDGDPRVFLSYVVAALEGALPSACPRSRALLGAADLPPNRVLAATLVNELDALGEELVLVLDDYHAVRSNAVHDIIPTLLAQRPRPFHLAIAARRDPPLPLASLRAAGQMTEVRLDDLRLSGEKTAAFLGRTVSIPIEEGAAEALREATEGWPAGLRLAALSLERGAEVARLVEGLHATGQHLVDYLATEVLADVPPDIQEAPRSRVGETPGGDDRHRGPLRGRRGGDDSRRSAAAPSGPTGVGSTARSGNRSDPAQSGSA